MSAAAANGNLAQKTAESFCVKNIEVPQTVEHNIEKANKRLLTDLLSAKKTTSEITKLESVLMISKMSMRFKVIDLIICN